MINRKMNVILFLLAILTAWLVFSTVFSSNTVDPNDKYRSNAFMENVYARHFNEHGQLSAAFLATTMWHFGLNNTTYIADPQFILYNEKQEPWTIHALKGKAFHGIYRVELWSHVIGYQHKGSNNVESRLRTEKVNIYPTRKYVETDRDVIAEQPGIIIKSRGAHLNLTAHSLNLTANVRGEYAALSH